MVLCGLVRAHAVGGNRSCTTQSQLNASDKFLTSFFGNLIHEPYLLDCEALEKEKNYRKAASWRDLRFREFLRGLFSHLSVTLLKIWCGNCRVQSAPAELP